MSDGDARVVLNALELAALTTEPDDDGVINITLKWLKNVFSEGFKIR